MRLLHDLGYDYDAAQNVFFTRIDAWQRKYGYCSLYDEGTAISGMILDCEPIYFVYDGNVYLLELWKGQYDLCMGAEVGFYRDSGGKLLGSHWFESVTDDMLPRISMTLYRDYEDEYHEVFERTADQWWLTGFTLGAFAEPEELALAARITFKDRHMLNPFMEAVWDVGYDEEEAYIEGDTAVVFFSEPKQLQPAARRSAAITVPVQLKNRAMCEAFSAIAGKDESGDGSRNIFEILADAKENSPDVYEEAIKLARRMEAYTSKLDAVPGIKKLIN